MFCLHRHGLFVSKAKVVQWGHETKSVFFVLRNVRHCSNVEFSPFLVVRVIHMMTLHAFSLVVILLLPVGATFLPDVAWGEGPMDLPLSCPLESGDSRGQDKDTCSAPPTKDFTVPFNLTQSFREGSKFRYQCINGYLRKAGTSSLIKCERTDTLQALRWNSGEVELQCIRDSRSQEKISVNTSPSQPYTTPLGEGSGPEDQSTTTLEPETMKRTLTTPTTALKVSATRPPWWTVTLQKQKLSTETGIITVSKLINAMTTVTTPKTVVTITNVKTLAAEKTTKKDDSAPETVPAVTVKPFISPARKMTATKSFPAASESSPGPTHSTSTVSPKTSGTSPEPTTPPVKSDPSTTTADGYSQSTENLLGDPASFIAFLALGVIGAILVIVGVALIRKRRQGSAALNHLAEEQVPMNHVESCPTPESCQD